MRIELKKISPSLMSRQAGKEALLALRPQLNELKDDEVLAIDFVGVTTFSPSWGDEFLTPLFEEYADRLILDPTDNLSVQDTLALLESMHGFKFKKML
ncbi:MAG: hypothetical protein Q8P56_06240 [Candidatus Uhrbacteria bacterium]|nr:hypothetical protein [Candidatus Uhrbacteria bacterium]